MSTDQFTIIAAVILGILIVIRLAVKVIRSQDEYERIEKNLDQLMKDKGMSYGNKDEHRDQRS